MKHRNPNDIGYYFNRERLTLAVVGVTGVLYNIGMTAGPWFEGRLAQTLCDIIGGEKFLSDMIILAVLYVIVIASVQLLRYAKRFYVRRFSNDVSREMKAVLYRNMVHKSRRELESEGAGSLMTKAISDVDTCAEGMRKFTTELFDTGVLLVAYLTMLLVYDWRIALISCAFPPFAYIAAEKLKKRVSRSAASYKESAGRLGGETLDRVSGALSYRILGMEKQRNASYGERLRDYEKCAVRAQLYETALQPLYQVVSMTGVIFIIYFGAKNVDGSGLSSWDIAAFTTFLTCFTRLAVKSSKAAKLFNAVQKARVSWQRIKPLLCEVPEDGKIAVSKAAPLCVSNLSFSYPDGKNVLENVSFTAAPGQVIGVTGPVACGKTTLGQVFLGEYPYSGSVSFGGTELSQMSREERCGTVGYMGHQTELFSDTVRENILIGEAGDCGKMLDMVCMAREIEEMQDGAETEIGSGGIRLSGGQQARIALARTAFHRRPLMILDDPFSALDHATEAAVMENLKRTAGDGIIILISHRLYLFPQTDKVLWIKDGRVTESTHGELLATNEEYRELYTVQTGGAADEK